jgi:2-oxoglutarate dehydrogenase complex dehydrogenase (E1) component-like enzyme
MNSIIKIIDNYRFSYTDLLTKVVELVVCNDEQAAAQAPVVQVAAAAPQAPTV